MKRDTDNIKRVVKDINFLIDINCSDETIQTRIENFILQNSERWEERCKLAEDYILGIESEGALVKHPIGMDGNPNKKRNYCYNCGAIVKSQKYCHGCGKKLLWHKIQ